MTKRYRTVPTKVGYPNGFKRFDPRIGKYVHVKPHTRNQKVRDHTYFDRVVKKQVSEND